MTFYRPQVETLRKRLEESPQFINIVAGPRQVGKTTLVLQAIEIYEYIYTSVDASGINPHPIPGEMQTPYSEIDGIPRDSAWLIRIWQGARQKCREFSAKNPGSPFILAIDEIQKVPRWSDTVKGLWDADRQHGLAMQVVLLGSSPLLMQKGMSESLTGRYEMLRATHWSFSEMHHAFNFTLDEYIFFGGYPGSARYIRENERWRDYVRGSLVQPSIETDILQMTRVDKPALLKQTFELAASYSGQILALKKLKGALDNAGNETTLADYINLLGDAGLLRGLQKYHVGVARTRASPPKFNVLNTALMSCMMPYTLDQALADRSYWGRLVESAVGAHLSNTASSDEKVSYWRESPHEVDFVISNAITQLAVEVKSGTSTSNHKGLQAFTKAHSNSKILVVGTGGIELTEFLLYPLGYWLQQA